MPQASGKGRSGQTCNNNSGIIFALKITCKSNIMYAINSRTFFNKLLNLLLTYNLGKLMTVVMEFNSGFKYVY